MIHETFTGYLTKYALSDGIKETSLTATGIPSMVKDTAAAEFSPYYHGEGRDWHRTRESAVKRAEIMRTKKIASLQKKIAELKALRFT